MFYQEISLIVYCRLQLVYAASQSRAIDPVADRTLFFAAFGVLSWYLSYQMHSRRNAGCASPEAPAQMTNTVSLYALKDPLQAASFIYCYDAYMVVVQMTVHVDKPNVCFADQAQLWKNLFGDLEQQRSEALTSVESDGMQRRKIWHAIPHFHLQFYWIPDAWLRVLLVHRPQACPSFPTGPLSAVQCCLYSPRRCGVHPSILVLV